MNENELTANGMRHSFVEFAEEFQDDIKQGLVYFYDYIVNKKVIPYKIKNRELTIEVLSLPAFTMQLTFENVIIEDGRHPREILMTTVKGERCIENKSTGNYRIKFINALNTEGIIKESSFTFDYIKIKIDTLDYNYNSEEIYGYSDKMPWRLLWHPISSLIEKWKIVGEKALNSTEIEYAIMFEFVYYILYIYLDAETKIGFGKSTLEYNKELFDQLPISKRMLRAARRLFEVCQCKELAEKIETFNDYPREVFADIIFCIIGKNGKVIFDYLRRIIDRCSLPYRIKDEISQLNKISEICVSKYMDKTMEEIGYTGKYPNYVRFEKAKFIETNFVYERKYTHLNEKKKIKWITFIESCVDDKMYINAIIGELYSRNMADEKNVKKAIDCFFSNDGRCSANVTDPVVITNSMEKEDIIDQLSQLLYVLSSK